LGFGFIKLIVFYGVYTYLIIYIVNRFSLYIIFPILKQGGKMNDLCILCKEPISTPLTIENIGKHIEMWLPQKIVEGFRKFNSKLKNHVREFYRVGDYIPVSEQLICIHCYVKETHQWLKRLDKGIAERFVSIFSFGYSRESFESSEKFRPVEEIKKGEFQFGICDECGEYNDKLEHVSGEWLCDWCSKYA